MTEQAYILIDAAVGRNAEVAEELRALPGVLSADMTSGPYDIIALVTGEDLSAVGNLVTGEIHSITGINPTVTCLHVGSPGSRGD
jgi:DNA-binding Lrp family transcriptional regulator